MTYTEKLLGGDPRDKNTHLSSGDKRQPTGSEGSIYHERPVDWNRWRENPEPPRRRNGWVGRFIRRIKRLVAN